MTAVLLLRVPSTGDRVGPVDPPISQGLVAAALRAAGATAEVLDLTWAGERGVDLLATALDDDDLRVVGMSTYQTNIERCRRLAAFVRARRPDVRVLFGGPQATHMPAGGLAAMPEVDGLCRGPAEVVLPRYLAALDGEGGDPQPGFLHRHGGALVDSGRPPPLRDEDCEHSPWELGVWPLDRYPLAVTFASRGCPYGCTFCYTPASSGRKVNATPVDRVVRDVVTVARGTAEHLFFADPIFVVDRGRVERLLDRLAALDVALTLSCELRQEHVDDRLLASMAAAGFVKVAYGLETANAGVLRAVRKPTNLDRFRDVVARTMDHGIAVEVFYMYGLPGETFADVLRTFDFVAGLHPLVDRISEPQQLQLYFGTELAARPAHYGIEVIGTRPPYLSPGTSYRTRHLGPDDFAALEEEWASRQAAAAAGAR